MTVIVLLWCLFSTCHPSSRNRRCVVYLLFSLTWGSCALIYFSKAFPLPTSCLALYPFSSCLPALPFPTHRYPSLFLIHLFHSSSPFSAFLLSSFCLAFCFLLLYFSPLVSILLLLFPIYHCHSLPSILALRLFLFSFPFFTSLSFSICSLFYNFSCCILSPFLPLPSLPFLNQLYPSLSSLPFHLFFSSFLSLHPSPFLIQHTPCVVSFCSLLFIHYNFLHTVVLPFSPALLLFLSFYFNSLLLFPSSPFTATFLPPSYCLLLQATISSLTTQLFFYFCSYLLLPLFFLFRLYSLFFFVSSSFLLVFLPFILYVFLLLYFVFLVISSRLFSSFVSDFK